MVTAALYTFTGHEKTAGRGLTAADRGAGGQLGFTPAIGASNAERPEHVLTWSNADLATWRALRDHWLRHRSGQSFMWQPDEASAEIPVRAADFSTFGPGTGRLQITYVLEEL